MSEVINQNQSPELACKYCHSNHVIKYGTDKGTQMYLCRDCGHKFARTDTIPQMQTPSKEIADVVSMYYEGLSERKIRRNQIQQEENYISTGSIYNWVNRFTVLAEKEAEKYNPKVGDTWIADETFIRIDKRKGSKSGIENPYDKSRKAKWVIFWDIIDADTRFLLASHVTSTRNKADAQALMEKAAERAGKTPKVVVTDKLAAYLDGVELAYGSDTQHKQGEPFTVENNTNLIERFHSTIKNRTEVMRALKNRSTLKKFMDGWLIHYNFFRPHMGIDDKTPAEEAGIKFPFKDWKDIVEQPYKVTSRIDIVSTPKASLPKVYKPKIHVPEIRGSKPRVTTLRTPRLSSRGKMHYSKRGGGLTRRTDI